MTSPEEREMRARANLKETLLCDDFVNRILVGDCPKCESNNVHDCESQTPIMEKSVMFETYRQYGSNCPVAKKLNDPGVGHCDDCNYLWCLDCGSELSVENPNCGHWLVCDECPEIDQDSECPECSYSGLESNCPRILKWKRKEETP
jgi:hypothetical protein